MSARLALGKNASPVSPIYIRAKLLRVLVKFPRKLMGIASNGRTDKGALLITPVRAANIRIPVSSRADITMDPNEDSVDLWRAAWTLKVSKGFGSGTSRLSNTD